MISLLLAREKIKSLSLWSFVYVCVMFNSIGAIEPIECVFEVNKRNRDVEKDMCVGEVMNKAR